MSLIAACTIGLFCTGAINQPGFSTYVQLSALVGDDTGAPGQIAHLGIRFEIADGWHIYWDGHNDSGLPTAVELDLPEGYEAMAIQWPAPHRYITGDNDLLDHVLEGDVTAIVPIRVPADARPGSTITIRGKADWLVCKEACIPGDGAFEASFEIGTAGPGEGKSTDDSDARRLDAARRRIPVPLPRDPASVGLDLIWEGKTLVIRATDARKMEFYPHASGGKIADRFASPVSESGTLRLTLSEGERIRGVVRIMPGERASSAKGTKAGLYAIDLAIGETRNARPDPAIGWRPAMRAETDRAGRGYTTDDDPAGEPASRPSDGRGG